MHLNLGSGNHVAPPPWVNVDTDASWAGVDQVADVAHLPYPDGSAERLYASHLCEHIPLEAFQGVLAEWRRVLRPGGELLVVVPDIERAIAREEPYELLHRIATSDFPPPQGHAWTCSGVVLRWLLEKVWCVTPVPMAEITPDWPVASRVEWQSGFLCR